MIDERERYERAFQQFQMTEPAWEILVDRRDRKRRNQRIAAGVVGIAVFVAAVWIVTSVGSLDRSETSVVPGGDVTGPAVTGPAVTGPISGATTPLPGLAVPSDTDYLVDLETGAKTPLPKSIVGTVDLTSDYAASPDRSRLAYVGAGDNGEAQIFVANVDGTEIEQVTVELHRASDPAWSPDGSKIAYVGRRAGDPYKLFVLELATGVSTQVTFDPRANAESVSFSSDGSSILYSAYTYRPGEDSSEVRIVPIAGGESVLLAGGDGVNAGGGALSPDGSLLSYSCWDPGDISDLCLANADGTDARVLVTEIGAAGSWSPDGTRIAGSWNFGGVYVVDVASGEVTSVSGTGSGPTWLDEHTLIVEADYCNLPSLAACPW